MKNPKSAIPHLKDRLEGIRLYNLSLITKEDVNHCWDNTISRAVIPASFWPIAFPLFFVFVKSMLPGP